MEREHSLKIGLSQMTPIWLNKHATLQKIKQQVLAAAEKQCELIVFSEALLPGYPFWLALTNGASFNDNIQKTLHAHYMQNAVQIEKGELDELCALAAKHKIAIYLGVVERPADRGGHSLYCSLVYINEKGTIGSVHRKLQPTYEERLCWAAGDGNGLQVHPLKQFSVGGLNCWENWMPLARTALYALGENLHIAVWPGSDYNTKEITRFIARESRSYVISVSSVMHIDAIPMEIPYRDKIIAAAPTWLANGASCIAGPDGEWILAPVIEKECLLTATIDIQKVWEERQNFDPSGHYSRPDITKLEINKDRQSIVQLRKSTNNNTSNL